MATLILPGAYVPPPVSPGGGPCTLSQVERETASRLGPFFDFVATGGTPDAVVVAGLRTNAPTGGYEGLYLLRREASQLNDRLRTVERLDGLSGSLEVDFPYAGATVAGEPFELHHLHPDQQLRADVRAGLRRCYLLDAFPVTPPVVLGLVGRATIREVGGDWDGWVVNGTNGTNGVNGLPLTVTGPTTLATRALPGAPAAVVDLTAQAFWLTDPRQVFALTSGGQTLAPAGRYGEANSGGWTCYAARGHVYLGIPAGIPLDGLTVRAYRDAFGLVNDADTPEGPTDDADELAVPVDYAAAFGHIEAWRRHRDRLEAAAAENRFASQAEASTEATRVASLYADFLFRPQTERGDRIGSPFGASSGGSSVNGLGGTGALAGAVVNQNDPYE